MSFGTAISSCFRQYVGFSGRARRSEYWYFCLFSLLTYVVAALLDAAINGQVFTVLVGLGLLLPGLAVAVRRLHDTDRSGAWILIGLVPLVGSIVLLVFACLEGQPHPNRYGPPPKFPQGGDWSQAPYPPAGYGQPYPQQQPYPPQGQPPATGSWS